MPSQGFDLLSSDFNHLFLITILIGLAVGVALLRKASKDKILRDIWA
jgi:hypothetical protein